MYKPISLEPTPPTSFFMDLLALWTTSTCPNHPITRNQTTKDGHSVPEPTGVIQTSQS